MHIGKIFIISSIISIITIILSLSKSVYEDYLIEKHNYKNIYNYVHNIDKTRYSGVLEIPSINLKTGIVNNVDEGITFITDRLIAGHSGNCKACYFDRLDKLEVGDNVYLYKDKQYKYIVDTIRILDKDNIHISGDLDLITCLKSDKNRRILVVLRLT